MIESDKSNQSRSNGRRSDASVSRRGFLKRLTAGGVMLAAPTFVSSSALGLGKAVAASERITVGAIGLGFHSRLNLPALARMPDSPTAERKARRGWTASRATTTAPRTRISAN